jgi:hypothetical protein
MTDTTMLAGLLHPDLLFAGRSRYLLDHDEWLSQATPGTRYAAMTTALRFSVKVPVGVVGGGRYRATLVLVRNPDWRIVGPHLILREPHPNPRTSRPDGLPRPAAARRTAVLRSTVLHGREERWVAKISSWGAQDRSTNAASTQHRCRSCTTSRSPSVGLWTVVRRPKSVRDRGAYGVRR